MNLIRTGLVLTLLAPLSSAAEPADTKPANKIPDAIRAILDNAEQFELFSLDPEPDKKGKEPFAAFNGWKVLGKTSIKAPEVRKQLMGALYDGIAASDGNGAKCFDPRHGIRATKGDKTIDLVICFECGWVYMFDDKSADRKGTAVSTGRPQATFDAVLKKANVPLPKQANR